MTAELVVGVDVGSQGTCAQAIAPDGERVATAYVPHTSLTPSRGGPSRTPASGSGPSAQALAEVRRAVDGDAVRAVSFGSQLDGLVAADAAGEPLGPALIWMDRRAGAECAAAAERIEPARLRELSGCNLDPGHVAAKIAWLREHRRDEHDGARWFLLPGSFVAWHASGEPAVDPSNASSTMLLDVEVASGRRRHAMRSTSTSRRLLPSARRTRCWARWHPGSGTPPGSTRRPRWCSDAATTWLRRWAPASSSPAWSAT